MRRASSSARAPRRVSGCATSSSNARSSWRAERPRVASDRPSTLASSIASPVRWRASRVVNQTLARRYAIAVATLAREQDAVERVGTDFRTMAGAIGERGLVADFFVAPVIERPDKERVLCDAFEGRVHPIALHARASAWSASAGKRCSERSSRSISRWSEPRAAWRGSACSRREPSTAPSTRGWYRSSKRSTARSSRLPKSVDPGLIGGLRIMMGDRRIDATISGRLGGARPRTRPSHLPHYES